MLIMFFFKQTNKQTNEQKHTWKMLLLSDSMQLIASSFNKSFFPNSVPYRQNKML